jgi:hypothetical protein
MLDGVVVDVIEVIIHVRLIVDGVFPKTSLPHATATLTTARVGSDLLGAADIEPTPSEISFDPRPTQRVTIVTGRQSPDRVEMIGKQHNRDHRQRKSREAFAHHRSEQTAGRLRGEQRRTAFRDNREEISPARNKVPSIVRQSHIVSRKPPVGQAPVPDNSLHSNANVRHRMPDLRLPFTASPGRSASRVRRFAALVLGRLPLLGGRRRAVGRNR